MSLPATPAEPHRSTSPCPRPVPRHAVKALSELRATSAILEALLLHESDPIAKPTPHLELSEVAWEQIDRLTDALEPLRELLVARGHPV